MLVFLFISLSWIVIRTDGLIRVTEERDGTDAKVCSPAFSEYENEETQGNLQICAVLFGKGNEEKWAEADKQCKNQYSFLLDLNSDFYRSSQLVNVLAPRRDLDFIWTGMRRMTGFYSWDSSMPRIFKASDGFGNSWAADDEPHPGLDCVALSTRSRKLVSKNCSVSLPYVCMNNGFPTKPINSPLCSSGWKFTYLLDSERSSCFRIITEPQDFAEASETCSSRQNGSLITAKDYQGVYLMLNAHHIHPNISAYWVDDVRKYVLGSCAVRAKTAPPAERTWKTFSCSDRLPFICKRPVDDSKQIRAWISRSGRPQDHMLMTCNVEINGKIIPNNEEALKFQWFKDGVPVTDSQPSVLPMEVSDETKQFGLYVSRQGSYQCRVSVAGHAGHIISEEADVFFSDVSTYVLTLQGHQMPDVTQDFSRIQFQLAIDSMKERIEDFVNETKRLFRSANWDFYRIAVKSDTVKWSILLFITWNTDREKDRPSSEETDVFHPLLEILQNCSQRIFTEFGFDAWDIVSADTCFEETMNISCSKQIRWPESHGTTSVASDPLCFDAQEQMITRTCKASFNGAHWVPFPHTVNFIDSTCNRASSSARAETSFCAVVLCIIIFFVHQRSCFHCSS